MLEANSLTAENSLDTNIMSKLASYNQASSSQGYPLED